MIAAAVLAACWLLGIGLLAVYFEVESVHCGARVQRLQERAPALDDELRRWEMRYNELVSPDVLEAALPEAFRAREDAEGTELKEMTEITAPDGHPAGPETEGNRRASGT